MRVVTAARGVIRHSWVVRVLPVVCFGGGVSPPQVRFASKKIFFKNFENFFKKLFLWGPFFLCMLLPPRVVLFDVPQWSSMHRAGGFFTNLELGLFQFLQKLKKKKLRKNQKFGREKFPDTKNFFSDATGRPISDFCPNFRLVPVLLVQMWPKQENAQKWKTRFLSKIF